MFTDYQCFVPGGAFLVEGMQWRQTAEVNRDNCGENKFKERFRNQSKLQHLKQCRQRILRRMPVTVFYNCERTLRLN